MTGQKDQSATDPDAGSVQAKPVLICQRMGLVETGDQAARRCDGITEPERFPVGLARACPPVRSPLDPERGRPFHGWLEPPSQHHLFKRRQKDTVIHHRDPWGEARGGKDPGRIDRLGHAGNESMRAPSPPSPPDPKGAIQMFGRSARRAGRGFAGVGRNAGVRDGAGILCVSTAGIRRRRPQGPTGQRRPDE